MAAIDFRGLKRSRLMTIIATDGTKMMWHKKRVMLERRFNASRIKPVRIQGRYAEKN
jgi:hypothetical protein